MVDFEHAAFRPPTAEEMQEQKKGLRSSSGYWIPTGRSAPADPFGSGTQAQTLGGSLTNQFNSSLPHRSPINPIDGSGRPHRQRILFSRL